MSLVQHKGIALLRLLRAENLFIIALTQVIIRYFVLQKILVLNNVQLALDNFLFALMVLSTVLIAGAGYIINDYFDVKTDLINHPDTVVVDKVIKRRWAIILHITLTLAGILLGVFVSLKTGYLRLAIFHIGAAILLWFYSTDFKRQLLTGNLVVSVLTASVIFMPFIFEMGIMQHVNPAFKETHLGVILSCLKVTVIYALFAFLTTLAREVIKDMEDYEGDKATGGRTMPIVWGLQSSRIFSAFVVLITIILLCVVIYNQSKFYRSLLLVSNVYIALALVLPLTVLVFLVMRATASKNFRHASILLKLIMLFGISYSLVFYYY